MNPGTKKESQLAQR